jgi:hypothetical protein
MADRVTGALVKAWRCKLIRCRLAMGLVRYRQRRGVPEYVLSDCAGSASAHGIAVQRGFPAEHPGFHFHAGEFTVLRETVDTHEPAPYLVWLVGRQPQCQATGNRHPLQG